MGKAQIPHKKTYIFTFNWKRTIQGWVNNTIFVFMWTIPLILSQMTWMQQKYVHFFCSQRSYWCVALCIAQSYPAIFTWYLIHTDKKHCIAWMHCKSLWIKGSAKCINVNVYLRDNGLDSDPRKRSTSLKRAETHSVISVGFTPCNGFHWDEKSMRIGAFDVIHI